MKKILWLSIILIGCGTRNNAPSVSPESKGTSSNIPSDSVCIPVFAIWTERQSNSRFDGSYDSISRLFQYCNVKKTQTVDREDVTIDQSNSCSATGPIRPMLAVIRFNDSVQFCDIVAIDSSATRMMILTKGNDTVITSTFKFSVKELEKIKLEIKKQSIDTVKMKKMMLQLKKYPVENEKFKILKSYK